MEDKKLVKDDINYMEYPIWLIGRKNRNKVWTMEKINGKYEMVGLYGLPNFFDKKVLYSLLFRLVKKSSADKYTLVTSRYEIAKDVYPGVKDFGKNKYNRISEALQTWFGLSINFQGTFYEDNDYGTRSFHIVSQLDTREKSGKLIIRFNASYIDQQNNTSFFRLIDFDQYRKLNKDSSARLYEILIKSFKGRNVWSIGLQNLAEKMTFEKREGIQNYYPSDILRHLKTAVNEINKKTDLSFNFIYNKETSVCAFKEITKQKALYLAATRDEKQSKKVKDDTKIMDEYMKKFKALSGKEQKEILDGIAKDQFLNFIKDKNMQIYGYMSRRKEG